MNHKIFKGLVSNGAIPEYCNKIILGKNIQLVQFSSDIKDRKVLENNLLLKMDT